MKCGRRVRGWRRGSGRFDLAGKEPVRRDDVLRATTVVGGGQMKCRRANEAHLTKKWQVTRSKCVTGEALSPIHDGMLRSNFHWRFIVTLIGEKCLTFNIRPCRAAGRKVKFLGMVPTHAILMRAGSDSQSIRLCFDRTRFTQVMTGTASDAKENTRN